VRVARNTASHDAHARGVINTGVVSVGKAERISTALLVKPLAAVSSES